MPSPLEYHDGVNRQAQRSIPALPAIFGMLLLPLLPISSPAQINSASASSNASAHFVAPPTGSVAPPTGSIAPPTGGVAPPTGAAFAHNGFVPSAVNPSGSFSHTSGSHKSTGHHHRHKPADSDLYSYPYVYGVAVPYAPDAFADNNGEDNDNDPDSQGGPTLFDHRASGPPSYVTTTDLEAPNDDEDDTPQPPADLNAERPQPATILIFKDGHQLQIDNYAIVSQTLYDLTPGHPRKIALADLDLPATEKQNDDRGIVFQLPSVAQAN